MLACLYLFLLGCAPGQHASVKGVATYGDEPIADGVVRFFPRNGVPGAGASAVIQEGKYSIDNAAGLYAGDYHVEVRGFESISSDSLPDEQVAGPGGSKADRPDELRVEIVPDRYNDLSTLEVTLEPGENRYDLNLILDQVLESQRDKQLSD